LISTDSSGQPAWPVAPARQAEGHSVKQTLFSIPIHDPWPLGQLGAPPGYVVLLVLWLIWGSISCFRLWRREGGFSSDVKSAVGWSIAVGSAIAFVPQFIQIARVPVYGYGAMMVMAAVGSGWTAARRSPLAGVSPQFTWDLALWSVLAGVVGARVFHLIQYHERVFALCQNPQDYLLAAINLPDGGLVLYGGIIAAVLTFVWSCHRQGISILKYGDAVVPAVFVGIACGRMGCFLNGCCFGDACDLPWAVSFPPESAAYGALKARGVISPDALATLPLHPTQIYSAINGLVLAGLLAAYYPFRQRDGSVLSLALIGYALSRICEEILRNDEGSQFGTGLTISQLISLGVLAFGLSLAWWSWTRTAPKLTSGAEAFPATGAR